MTFEETRDNLTDIENQSIEADAHEDTRDVWAGTDIYIDEGDARADIENTAIFNPGSWKAQRLAQAEAMFGKSDGKIAAEKKIAREHDEIVAKARQESEERNGPAWNECQCEACTSDEHNDGANGYENHQGDGPSGFDYYQDTKWCC